ncbi:MAG: O-antigen ligase family protein [Ignavibacteria bacterium]|nr:MAG: O-antigen ligase family protein [Ignavibacteria bacterium]
MSFGTLASLRAVALRRQGAILRVIYSLTLVAVVSVTFSVFLSSVAMGSAIVLWLTLLIAGGKEAFPATPLDRYFLFYLSAEALATIFSVEPGASLFNMKRFFLISFVYLGLLAMTDLRRLRSAVAALVCVAVILSCVEIFTLSSFGGHYARLSLFQHSLTEGGIKLIVLLFIIPFMIRSETPRAWRLGAAAAGIPLFVGLILTQSRSSWLGLVGGVLAIGMLQNRKIIILLVLVIVLFALFAPADFQSRALSIFDPAMPSNLSRIHMMTTGWKMFLDRPVFGVGDIDLKRIYVTYITPIEEGEGGHLHNNLMMLLVTLGIGGAAATAALFVQIFLTELRAVRATRHDWMLGSLTIGSLAAYVGFHINGLFEWNFGDHEIAVLLWFTVGAALVAQKIAAEPGETAS